MIFTSTVSRKLFVCTYINFIQNSGFCPRQSFTFLNALVLFYLVIYTNYYVCSYETEHIQHTYKLYPHCNRVDLYKYFFSQRIIYVWNNLYLQNRMISAVLLGLHVSLKAQTYHNFYRSGTNHSHFKVVFNILGYFVH